MNVVPQRGNEAPARRVNAPMRTTSLLTCCLALAAPAQQTSVLFLGNSYTSVNNLPGLVQQLALSMGDTVNVQMVAPGGFTLYEHSTTLASINAINAQAWDYVVMHEQSQLGALPDAVTGSAGDATALANIIAANDSCTVPVYYMTWGRQTGDMMNCANFPFMCTYEGMQLGLRDNYVGFAEDNNGWTAPVGMAWREVRNTHPFIELYQTDGSHPNINGSYLAAAVMYCTLFQQSCTSASFNSTLQPDSAAILRSIASSMVLDSASTWNLDNGSMPDAAPTGSSSNGAYEITWHHAGQGTHLWTCSNGQTSTDPDPTFTFAGPGIYAFTHQYTDACVRSAEATWTLEVFGIGIDETDGYTPYQVRFDADGTLSVSGATGGEQLRVFDAQGRALFDGPLVSTIALPKGIAPGLLLWSITDHDAHFTGKVVR